MNIEGLRTDGSVRNELIARVYAASDAEAHDFTLYEDDGRTNDYQNGAVASTRIEQYRQGRRVLVTIEPTAGTYSGAPRARKNVIELVAPQAKGAERTGVLLDGAHLPRLATWADFEAAASGFFVEASGQVIRAKSAQLAVTQPKVFEFILE